MEFKKYTIQPGHQYSTHLFNPTFSNTLYFEGYFEESCLYHFNTVDDYDINKLIGLSTSYSHHHQSARVGWRCLDGESIQLLPYVYTYGTRIVVEDPLATVKPLERFCGTITAEHYKYTVTVNDAAVSYQKGKDWLPFNYILHPFFGGNMTAPNLMNIYLKRW